MEKKEGEVIMEPISAEELKDLKSDLDKKKDDIVECLNLINLLKRKRITADLLKKTLIGKTIKLLATKELKPTDPAELKEIKQKSKELEDHWRDVYKRSKKLKPTTGLEHRDKIRKMLANILGKN